MNSCDFCDKPFKDGDQVVVEIFGQWVADRGGFLQSEEETVSHEECPG